MSDYGTTQADIARRIADDNHRQKLKSIASVINQITDEDLIPLMDAWRNETPDAALLRTKDPTRDSRSFREFVWRNRQVKA